MIGIIILNYRSSNDVSRLVCEISNNLKALAYKIIIVDNFSSSDEVANVERIVAEHDLLLIKSKKNLGYGKGNNLGIEYCFNNDIKHVLILNSDIYIDENFEAGLDEAIGRDVEISGPVIMDHRSGRVQSRGGVISPYTCGGRLVVEKTDKIDFVSGCCILINLNKLGCKAFFDKDYFLYYEDVQLCMNLFKESGNRPQVVGGWNVSHVGAGVSEKGSEVQIYHSYFSRVLFCKKNYGFNYTVWIILISFIGCIKNFITGHGLKHLYVGVKGVVDGVKVKC